MAGTGLRWPTWKVEYIEGYDSFFWQYGLKLSVFTKRPIRPVFDSIENRIPDTGVFFCARA